MPEEDQGFSYCRKLLKGPSPSHVRELEKSRYPLAMYEHGLIAGESAYEHGGYINIPELPSGVGVRRSGRPDIIEESAYLRILQPAGGWLAADTLEALAFCAETYGKGLVHFTSGGTIEIYTTREQMVPMVRELNAAGLDVGSTGNDLRCLTACCGPLRCDAALIDAPALATYLGQRFIDEQQYPGYPQKVKSGIAGCPNDCIRAMMQKDHSFIGVYRDLPQIDDEILASWLADGGDISVLVSSCPTSALAWTGSTLIIDPEKCWHCMVCINLCPALRPGRERGVAWVVGGKYGHRGPQGPMVGYVLVPFIPVKDEDYTPVGDLFGAFLELWADNARKKERIGDFIARVGPLWVLKELGLKTEPQILISPKRNGFQR
ncbi:4Fe-4S binding protein [Neomoorella humiferrea]|jgi:sulfite reductase alpha subunit|uniref:4Fe-4S binding protein n=1 Tax=Neomoorella humiferrea TaxID=676965 RepID=UPI003D8CF590